MTQVHDELPLTSRIYYGSGATVFATKEAAYAMFVLIYYTQVLGLSGTLVGIMIALGLVWDAISDPLVGAWSDRVKSRHGRRHSFMLFGIVPSAVGVIGLFSPPDWAQSSSAYLAGWLLFWSLWVRTFTTFFSIPHLALSAELSGNYVERNQIMAMRMAFLFSTIFLLPAVALFAIFNSAAGEPDGRLVSDNYLHYGYLSCAVVLLAGVACTLGTYRYRFQGRDHKSTQAVTLTALLKDLLSTLGNRNYVFVVS